MRMRDPGSEVEDDRLRMKINEERDRRRKVKEERSKVAVEG